MLEILLLGIVVVKGEYEQKKYKVIIEKNGSNAYCWVHRATMFLRKERGTRDITLVTPWQA